MKHKIRSKIIFVVLMIGLGACGNAPESKVTITLESQQSLAFQSLMEALLPSANAATQQVNLCFRRIRFRLADPAHNETIRHGGVSEQEDEALGVEDQIDINIGRVALTGGSTKIADIQLKAGIYDRVTFDVDSRCGGPSVEVIGDQGTYSTSERLRARFYGSFEAKAAQEQLLVRMSDLWNALGEVRSNGDIVSAFESRTGRME